MPRILKKDGISRDELRLYLGRQDITPAQRRLAELRLEYSEIGQIRNTQLRALSVERLYPTVLPIQVTGRWSYLKPNMSAFSKKCINPEHPKGQHSRLADCWGVQDCIRPDKGTFWIEHDLDAVEHRFYCLVLQWKERLDELALGWDIHTPVACTLFDLPLPQDKLDPHKGGGDQDWRELVKWQGKDDQRRTLGKNMTYGGQYFYVRAARAGEKVRQPYRIYQGLWYNPTYVYTIPNLQTFKVIGADGIPTAPDYEALGSRFVESTVHIQHRKALLQEKCRVDKYSRNLYGGLRRAYFSNQETAKYLFNYIIQSTVAEYIDETIIELAQKFPTSYTVHNKHDSITQAFYYESTTDQGRREEEQQILEEVKGIAQRTQVVGEYSLPITATFKVTRREE